MILVIQQWSPITSVITSAISLVWVPICSVRLPSRRAPRSSLLLVIIFLSRFYKQYISNFLQNKTLRFIIVHVGAQCQRDARSFGSRCLWVCYNIVQSIFFLKNKNIFLSSIVACMLTSLVSSHLTSVVRQNEVLIMLFQTYKCLKFSN